MRRFELLLFLSALLVACPGDDDDSAIDDDDSAVADDDDAGDDDAGDDDAGDDDAAGDDDTGPVDYTDATVPDSAGCTGNEARVILGDGTALTATTGLVPNPTSFANNNGQFSIRVGADGFDDNAFWIALQGNANGLAAGTAGLGDSGLTLQGWVGGTHIAGAPAALAGAYGVPLVRDPAVTATINFTAVPGPGSATSGTFEAILQKTQAQLGQTILLGVSGCWDGTLQAED